MTVVNEQWQPDGNPGVEMYNPVTDEREYLTIDEVKSRYDVETNEVLKAEYKTILTFFGKL